MIALKKTEETTPTIGAGTRMNIPVDKLHDSPTNPRKTFSSAAVTRIAMSMKQIGQQQPIVVRAIGMEGDERYEIAAGHTRKRAAIEAGLPTLDAIVRDISDDDMIVIGLAENGDREDLPPLEEADAYKALVERGWSIQRIADRTGKSESHVGRRLQVTKVCAEVREAVSHDKLLANAAAQIARLESHDDQRRVLAEALKTFADGKPISADDIEYLVRGAMRVLTDAPFDVKDGKLVKGVKACGLCPKRTLAQSDMFPEGLDSKDRCLDGGCWTTKVEAHDGANLERWKKRGLPILNVDESKRVFPFSSTAAGGFIRLDAECYVGHEAGQPPRKWSAVVEGDVGRFVAFDLVGRPHEVMKEVDARKAAGFVEPKKPTPPSPTREPANSPYDSARDEADDDSAAEYITPSPAKPVRSLEDEHAIVAAIVERSVRRPDMAVWQMLRVLVDPDTDFDAIAKRRGWSDDDVEQRLVHPKTMADAVGLFVEALIAGAMLEGQRNIALQRLGMSADEILASKKAKTRAKAKKAEAKKPTKKPTKPSKKAKGRKR